MALDLGATVSELVRWLIEELGGPIQGTISTFIDNRSTIRIGSNPVQTGRNLHVHARFYYCRDLVWDRSLQLDHLSTDKQIGDVCCSYKGGPAFYRLRGYLMDCARVILDESGVAQWQTREECLASLREEEKHELSEQIGL